MNKLSEAEGRSRTFTAYIDPWPAKALASTLDLGAADINGDLPMLWHWLYFLETAPQSLLGGDGHPKRGDFLPPVPLPRRMFAGARTTIFQPLQVGHEAELTETIQSVVEKSANMIIITVGYQYRQYNTLCVEEERDFIYLPLTSNSPDKSSPEPETKLPVTQWQLSIVPDSRLLFRYSALTFNSHRIHYDLEYATEEEGYPGLVVQGPLSATLLAELARLNSSLPIRQFSFRAQRPLFSGESAHLCGTPGQDGHIDLAVYKPNGVLAVSARAST